MAGAIGKRHPAFNEADDAREQLTQDLCSHIGRPAADELVRRIERLMDAKLAAIHPPGLIDQLIAKIKAKTDRIKRELAAS